MNLRLVSKIIGIILCTGSISMIPSLLLSIAVGDHITYAFLCPMLIGLALGVAHRGAS